MSDEESTKKFAVWWLSPADCEAIGEDVDGQPWPSYVKEQYGDLLGRAGRGRLWISPDITIHSLDWDTTKPLASRAESCGGIVIRAEDVTKVATLPGFITDTSLDAWVLGD